MRYQLSVRRAAILALAVCGGCGGAPPITATASPTGTSTPPPPSTAASGIAEVSRDDCLALVDHVLALGLADRLNRHPKEPPPAPAHVAATRAQLVTEHLSACLVMPRAEWACALAAPDRDQLYACAAGPATGR